MFKQLGSKIKSQFRFILLGSLVLFSHFILFGSYGFAESAGAPNSKISIESPYANAGTVKTGSFASGTQPAVCPHCETTRDARLSDTNGVCVTPGCGSEIQQTNSSAGDPVKSGN